MKKKYEPTEILSCIIAAMMLLILISAFILGNRLIKTLEKMDFSTDINYSIQLDETAIPFILYENGMIDNGMENTQFIKLTESKQIINEAQEIKLPEYESLGEFKLTAYCPCVKCCGIWSEEHPSRQGTDFIQKTAFGTIPTANRTIGVNTDIIPFGTIVLINGVEYVAEDRGNATKRNPYLIDIFMSNHESAINFGIQNSEVFIIK